MRQMKSPQVLGRVVGLWRYPVKSMAGEAVKQVEVSWHGLAGDRRWAFVRDGARQSGFPWLTLRERPDMNHFRPSFVDPTRPDQSLTRVQTSSGESYDITDPVLAALLCPGGGQVIRQNRGIFDTFPLSLISTRSIAQLSDTVGSPLAVQRFRPNILVETAAGLPFAEDQWVGSVLHIGSLRLRVDKRDGRCVVITIDPQTGERNPAVLRSVISERQGCLGVYGTTVEPGRIALDDAVLLE